MFNILLFALLALGLVRADNCKFTAYEPVTLDDAYACLGDIALDTKEREQTITAVEDYLDYGVFNEYYGDQTFMDKMHLPTVNIHALVKKIEEEHYTKAYDFHWAMMRAMLQLKDPHAVYRSPACLTKFYYLLPFAVSARMEDNSMELYLNHLPHNYAFATMRFLQGWEGHSGPISNQTAELIFEMATNKTKIEVLTITNKNNEVKWGGDGVSPIEAMKQWANEFVYVSRNEATRFNRAIMNDFWIHGSDFGKPDTHVYVTMEGVEYELPWMAVPTISIGSTDDLMAYCPLVALDDDPVETEDRVNGKLLSGQRTFGPHPRPQPHDPMRRMVEELKTRHPPGPTGYDLAPFLARVQRVLNGEKSDLEAVPEGSLIRIFTGDEVSWYNYTSTKGANATVISVPSFSPADPDQFVSDLRYILDSLVPVPVMGEMPRHNHYLIFDFRDNGGGYVHLGVTLLQYLFPNLARPSSGLYQRKKVDLNEMFVSSGFMDDDEPLYEYLSHTQLGANSDFYTDKKYEVVRAVNGSNIAFMTDYTFGNPDFFTLAGTQRTDRGDWYKVNLPWRADEIIYLTEGYCGSTCATFALHAREVNAGMFVGLGGFWDSATQPSTTSPLTVGSFAGGSVSDSQYVEAVIQAYELQDDTRAPTRFPRNNYIRYPENGLLSWIDNETPLEFTQLTPQIMIPYWPKPDVGATSRDLAEVLDAVLDRVYDGNLTLTEHAWKVDVSVCTPDVKRSVGGNFWDLSIGNWSADCRPVYCDTSSYVSSYDPNGFILECTQMPASQWPAFPWDIISIVFIVVSVVYAVLVAVFWLIQTRRGKKMGYKIEEKTELLRLKGEGGESFVDPNDA